jgi:hypothetical protein
MSHHLKNSNMYHEVGQTVKYGKKSLVIHEILYSYPNKHFIPERGGRKYKNGSKVPISIIKVSKISRAILIEKSV